MNTFKERVNGFMYIYMYELELTLNENIALLDQVKFHNDEANVDRQLKEFLKHFITERFNAIPKGKLNYKLIIRRDKGTTFQENELNYRDYSDLTIQEVLLPEELSHDLKREIANSKSSVYTNPDISLKITCSGTSTFVSVELKSTKNDSIPGSSIQQINPDEWVIFVKHAGSGTSVATGQYINTINSKLQFPDRSPRPQVSFKELEEWNYSFRKQNGSNIKITMSDSNLSIKGQLLHDWQNFLADRWVGVLFSGSKKNSEPWFNNALRKFAVKFIKQYEALGVQEKAHLLEELGNLITEDNEQA